MRFTTHVTLIVAAVLSIPALAAAQSTYDSSRAYIPETAPYDPFYVTSVLPLADAVDAGRLHDGSPLIIMVRSSARLALSLEQMAYHHIAQGEMGGEPWMVTF